MMSQSLYNVPVETAGVPACPVLQTQSGTGAAAFVSTITGITTATVKNKLCLVAVGIDTLFAPGATVAAITNTGPAVSWVPLGTVDNPGGLRLELWAGVADTDFSGDSLSVRLTIATPMVVGLVVHTDFLKNNPLDNLVSNQGTASSLSLSDSTKREALPFLCFLYVNAAGGVHGNVGFLFFSNMTWLSGASITEEAVVGQPITLVVFQGGSCIKQASFMGTITLALVTGGTVVVENWAGLQIMINAGK